MSWRVLSHGVASARRARELSVGVQRLLSESRPRLGKAPSAQELRADGVVAAAFVLAAVTLALLFDRHGDTSPGIVALFVVVYALTSRVEFDVGAGFGVPTILVLIPMEFTLPPGWVPLLVAAAYVLGRLPAYVDGSRHPARVLGALASSWYAIGPSVVVALLWDDGLHHRPEVALLVAVLAAQIACNLTASLVFEWLRIGELPKLSLRLLIDVYVTDVCLAPIGFAAAFFVMHHPAGVVLTLPLSGLLVVFAQERRARIANTLELSQAYRGTALLLGELVENDDSYTASHSRDVVELATAVGPRLGLDEDQMRRLEFAALLHDLGKIAIPNSIINKAGPLSTDERALIETHTMEGEALLLPVGGLLGEVGRVVRSCHERYDGLGYPDGLAGERIPIEARIVAACDAFNAMTTDRPYRAALSLSEAIEELRVHRATQFDPAVVDVLLAMHADRLPAEPAPADADGPPAGPALTHAAA